MKAWRYFFIAVFLFIFIILPAAISLLPSWHKYSDNDKRDIRLAARVDFLLRDARLLGGNILRQPQPDLGSSQKTESMVTPVFATPILTTSWLA